MVPVVEINGISDIPDAVCLGLPKRLAESGALQLVARFKELVASGVKTFVLDLSETQRITDAGIGAISHLFSQMGEHLIFLSPSKSIASLLWAVGLVAPMVSSMDEVKIQLKEAP